MIWAKVILLTWLTGAPVEHVTAAVRAETEDIPARQLLTQAWLESRWRAPRELVIRKHPRAFVCGALQLRRTTLAACKKINADLTASYREAVEHIMAWKGYCERLGLVRDGDWKPCALAGYGGGIRGARGGSRAYRYAHKVLRGAGV